MARARRVDSAAGDRLATVARHRAQRRLTRNRPRELVAIQRTSAGLESAGTRRRLRGLLDRGGTPLHAGPARRAGIRARPRRQNRPKALGDTYRTPIPREPRPWTSRYADR